MFRRHFVQGFLFWSSVLCLHYQTTLAVIRTWDGGGGDNRWDTNASWTDDSQPFGNDNAVIPGGAMPLVDVLEQIASLSNSGDIQITAGTLQPSGAIDNLGTINIGDGSPTLSQLIVGSANTLSGSGEVVLKNSDDAPGSNSVLSGGTTAALAGINGAGHTIRGEGTISQHWINEGIVRAEETTGDSSAVLRLDNTTFTNNGVGTVPLEGSYTINQALAHLEIEIGGLTAGSEHDQLSSTGTVDLGGTLDVLPIVLGNGYVPSTGDRFEIINATSPISGVFDSANFPSTGFGRALTWLPVDYTTDPNKVFLEIATVDFLSADFDEDDDVDGNDLAQWEGDFGVNGLSDADSDGDSDGADFLVWQQQFGLGTAPLAASGAVPAILLATGVLFGLSKWHRPVCRRRFD